MQKKDFLRAIISGCDQMELHIEQEQTETLYLYFAELQRWAKKINLIAKASTSEQIVEKHFLDSLSLLLVAKNAGSHLLDIGTGAGFPGLVCKVARPEMRLTLVEPRLKRVSFLKHIIRSLQLQDVIVSAGRIEDETTIASDAKITYVTSRAVNEIGLFCTMVERFTDPELRVICMKGPRWEQELVEAEKKHNILINDYKVTEVCLPSSDAKRFLVDFAIGSIQKI